jgi:hypothetical protein
MRIRNAPAREAKLLLTEQQAREVEERLKPLLSLDPHCDASGGYELTTLYCDTPHLDVFRRRGRYRLFKFRLRRYGQAERIYLERKSKQGTRVRKRRDSIALDQIGHFDRITTASDWNGAWYHSQLLRNRFGPVCLIQYDRVAWFGDGGAGPVRLTFDRNVRGGLASQWSFAPSGEIVRLLPDQVVCEFKFPGSLPAIFKTVLQEMQLTLCGVSKYRHCVQALALGERSINDSAVTVTA